MDYELLDGMNVQGDRSTVTVEPDGDRSLVRRRSTYESAGPLTRLILRTAVANTCKRVAKAAGR